jgi:hypothetical protein
MATRQERRAELRVSQAVSPYRTGAVPPLDAEQPVRFRSRAVDLAAEVHASATAMLHWIGGPFALLVLVFLVLRLGFVVVALAVIGLGAVLSPRTPR